jgi:hypothetical protein
LNQFSLRFTFYTWFMKVSEIISTIGSGCLNLSLNSKLKVLGNFLLEQGGLFEWTWFPKHGDWTFFNDKLFYGTYQGAWHRWVFNDDDVHYGNMNTICEIFYNYMDFFVTANMTD